MLKSSIVGFDLLFLNQLPNIFVLFVDEKITNNLSGHISQHEHFEHF